VYFVKLGLTLMLENDRINYMNFFYIEGNQIGGFYEYLLNIIVV